MKRHTKWYTSLLKSVQLQLFISFISLPFLIGWGLPISLVMPISTLMFSPFLTCFLLVSSLIFFLELFYVPNTLFIWCLEQITTTWLACLNLEQRAWLIGFQKPPIIILLCIPLVALALMHSKKIITMTTRTSLLALLLVTTCGALKLFPYAHHTNVIAIACNKGHITLTHPTSLSAHPEPVEGRSAGIWQYYHQLPESAAGAELTQHEARAFALKAIQEQFNLTPENIIEISAQSSQLPHRKDWTFIFADPAAYPLQTGQARISVKIAGDEIVDNIRSIHVPEEWERAEQHNQNMLINFMIVFVLIFICLLLFLMYLAYKKNNVFTLSKRLFFILFGILCIIFCIDSINGWPNIIGVFNTSEPLTNQLFQSITALIIGVLLKAIFYAGILSYVMSYKKSHQLPADWLTIIIGICTGFFATGIYAIMQSVVPANMPLWPHYESLGYAIPLLGSLTGAILYYAQLTITFSLLFMLIDTLTQHLTLFAVFTALCGMLMMNLSSLDVLGIWIIDGALFGWVLLAMYRYVIRYDYALIPLATSSFVILQIAQQGIFNAYPGAIMNAIVSVCTVGMVTALIFKQSIKNSF